MNFALALIVFLIIMLSLAYYIYVLIRRALHVFFPQKSVKRLRITAIILAILVMVPTFNFFSSWLIIVLHIASFAIVCDILYLLTRKWLPKKVATLHHITLIPLLATACIISYGYYNIHHPIKTTYTIETSKAIPAVGYKIAFISDLHTGLTLYRKGLEKYAREIEQQKPDIVLLGGDLVDEHTTLDELQMAFDVLGTIDSRFGTYFVYGNHDESNYTNDKNYSKKQLDAAITRNNIHILDDTVTPIDKHFTLIGRRDLSLAPRKSAAELMKKVDKTDFSLMLDHQPVETTENNQLGVDLMMSGHTHAGQIWPAGYVIELMGNVSYGEKKWSNMQQIVSSGIAGWGYPIRTEHHSEYVIVTVKPQ
ncbi:metallophosphoesterase [Kurthia huakuii]|uniref:metallophosphoesterase n=1 Tax=Kurthia huakuii TaxID=1421019 RepID=UPI000496DE97|nr:metallophosphoesterase [Kurthia huakuii]MBM7699520.1 putative MPP superfamily phosphohydrolase [Kurthia huakuii]